MTSGKQPSNYKAVLRHYEKCPKTIRKYFDCLPNLIRDYQYPIPIAYIFLLTEKAHVRALYSGVVKLHRAEATLARKVLDREHLTRDGFLALFKNVFGESLDSSTIRKLQSAESVRDNTIHGKTVSQEAARQALVDVLDYASQFNAQLLSIAGFEPFGDLRGF